MYNKIVQKVQDELAKNTEWRARYAAYIGEIREKSSYALFKKAQRMVKVSKPLQLYMPLSTIKNCTENRVEFDLRFRGQSVAQLYVKVRKGETGIFFKPKAPAAILAALRAVGMKESAAFLTDLSAKTEKWGGENENAKHFRALYSALDKAIVAGKCVLRGQPEHEMESALLQNFAQKSKEGKEIFFIQPITMMGTRARFQMPTPIKASDVKKGANTICYSAKNGGGIDILARAGRGSHTMLTIMELKDENTKSESPDVVVGQALAYAAFLRELLRSASGDEWWNFFGFSGDVPRTLRLRAVVVMPLRDKKGEINEETTAFMGKVNAPGGLVLKIGETDGSGDKIELGYVFREAGQPPQMSF